MSEPQAKKLSTEGSTKELPTTLTAPITLTMPTSAPNKSVQTSSNTKKSHEYSDKQNCLNVCNFSVFKLFLHTTLYKLLKLF